MDAAQVPPRAGHRTAISRPFHVAVSPPRCHHPFLPLHPCQLLPSSGSPPCVHPLAPFPSFHPAVYPLCSPPPPSPVTSLSSDWLAAIDRVNNRYLPFAPLQMESSELNVQVDNVATHTPLKVRDVNVHLVCSVCRGYLIDATTVTECLHSCNLHRFRVPKRAPT